MFRFKKFSVNQQRSAMKVGVDGVLLGAWADVSHQPQTVLDIGTGTGLVALMLAQRCDAVQIDALEIDADAFEEAVENFEQSPWNDRLFCFHASLDDFMDELEDETYDLIVCNPPYFSANVPAPDPKRQLARQSDSLPFEDLLEASGILLSEDGILCVVIPHADEARFCELAAAEDLFVNRVLRVKGTAESPVKRSLLSLSRVQTQMLVQEMVIEKARHEYIEDYKALTRDFYLKF